MTKKQVNVPIPPSKRGRTSIYPFSDLEIGESIFIPDKTVSQVNSAYQQYRKKYPDYKLVLRTEDDGCRVWRIES